VETIGLALRSIPQGLPAFALPEFSWETVKLLVTPTITIALLGAIESLLCARVADQLSSLPRHDPNQELMAQGIANFVGSAFRRHAGHRHHRPRRSPTSVQAAPHPWQALFTLSRWLDSPAGRAAGAARAAGGVWPASCCSWPGTWASGTSSPG
jgi:hypothetical protein